MKKQLGFISAAPRISTRPETQVPGPRTRVLGLIKGFEALDWEVKRFIVGDRVSQKLIESVPEKATNGKFFPTLAADLARLVLSTVNTQRSWQELGGRVDWAFEFAATMQTLGWNFKQHGVPWIVHTEGILFQESKAERKSIVLSGVARRLEMRTYRECDALVCVSETLKELLVRESGILPEKVVVIPNGVDTDVFDPKQYEPKRLFPGFTVGFVGGLYMWQAVDVLLECVHALRAEGMDLSVVVVGDGIMYETWRTQADSLGIASNVAFVGRVPWAEVPEYIAGFDVCYTGQIEIQQVGRMYHSPLKLYEYMAMAKPIVASAFEDAQRMLQDGETGFLFEPGNKEDLKRALTRAYHSKEQLSLMGQQAREVVLTQHSWVARVKTMIEGIEQILAKKQ
jgi:glycosyltransferase involved in cell wall biosynthesis